MAKAVTGGQISDILSRISGYFLQTNEDFTGATASAAGEKGMVPAPAAGDNTKFMRGDGTWASLSETVFVVSTTTQTGNVIWIKPTD